MTRTGRRGVLTALVVVVVALAALVVTPGPFGPAARAGAAVAARTAAEPGPFRGLGTWVDAYDYVPSFQRGGVPPVTDASVPDMAALGVDTLYLQVVRSDPFDPAAPIQEPALVGQFVTAAHRHGMEVVAWYLPFLDDLAADTAVVEAMAQLRVRGQRFDALALDVEWTDGVRETDVRNDRAVTLAKRTQAAVGPDAPIGAIVYPAVQIEVLNPTLWPKFPYKRLAQHVDVWMPMAYWTFRDGPYRTPANYVGESIDRLRTNLGDKRAVVAPIGGIADGSSTGDYESFVQVVRSTKSVGWSVYDFVTTSSAAWPVLRSGHASAGSTP